MAMQGECFTIVEGEGDRPRSLMVSPDGALMWTAVHGAAKLFATDEHARNYAVENLSDKWGAVRRTVH